MLLPVVCQGIHKKQGGAVVSSEGEELGGMLLRALEGIMGIGEPARTWRQP